MTGTMLLNAPISASVDLIVKVLKGVLGCTYRQSQDQVELSSQRNGQIEQSSILQHTLVHRFEPLQCPGLFDFFLNHHSKAWPRMTH